MKKTCIALALCALFVFASATETASQLEALLQMNAQASGAIETALGLLEDLRKASQNERNQVEKRNKSQEEFGTKLISDLSGILANQQKNQDAATAHRIFLQKEINDTEAHLEWIDNRLVEIERKLKELASQRCKGNMILIETIREHIDAIRAIKTLEGEIQRLHASGELAEISSLTEKLQVYGHLFEKDTIQKFLELGQPIAGVDEIKGFADNTRAELKLDGPSTNPGQRNLKGGLADKVIQMLKDLQVHLKKSIEDLQAHAIQAAYDYADFQSNSRIENVTLREDHARKEKYIAKLEIDVEVAIENEDNNVVLRDEAQLNLDSAVTDLETKRAFYNQEIARIREDVSTIEQVIDVFRKKILTLTGALQDRIEEVNKGDKLTQQKRRTDKKTKEEWVKGKGGKK